MTIDESVEIVYFAEAPQSAGAIRLAAAVVWRGALRESPGGAWTAARDPIAWLRRLRQRLWLRFGPLGIDLHLRGARRGSFVQAAGFGPGGEPVMYYQGGRRVLRLLDRVYKVPAEGQTLVLLVDAARTASSEPRITVRMMSVPAVHAPSPASGDAIPDAGTSSERQVGTLVGDHPAWEAALRADPEVGAFLEGASGA